MANVCLVCAAPNPTNAATCQMCGAPLGAVKQPVPPPDVLPPGTQLQGGAFTVGQVLGQGGFGITYRGAYSAQHSQVAIKELFLIGECHHVGLDVQVPSPKQQEFAEAKRKFLEEAQTLRRIQHPGIVEVYACFEERNTAYMAMEFVAGRSLQKLLDERGPLPPDEAARFVAAVGEALAAVHAAGYLHRDLKPDNVMLATGRRVVLIDFGTARQFIAGQTQGITRVVTDGFAPLEQYGSAARFGPYTDVYALGATLYYLLTGHCPPASTDRANGIPLPAPSDLQAGVSTAVSDAVLWAMQMKAPDRPQTALDFVAALRQAASVPATPLPLASRPAWVERLRELRQALAQRADAAVNAILTANPDLERLLWTEDRRLLDELRGRGQASAALRGALLAGDDAAIVQAARSPLLAQAQLVQAEREAVAAAIGRRDALDALERAIRAGDDAGIAQAFWQALELGVELGTAQRDAALAALRRNRPSKSFGGQFEWQVPAPTSEPLDRWFARAEQQRQVAAAELQAALAAADEQATILAWREARRTGAINTDDLLQQGMDAAQRGGALGALRKALGRQDDITAGRWWRRISVRWPEVFPGAPGEADAGNAAYRRWGRRLRDEPSRTISDDIEETI